MPAARVRNRWIHGFDSGLPGGAGSRLRNNMRRRSMVTHIRADGNWVGDPVLTRRTLALALAGGYAVAAYSADADPIHTDEDGLVTATVEIQAADRKIPGYLARPAAKGKHPVVFVNSEVFGV